MNDEQVRLATVRLVNELIDFASTMPDYIAGCFDPKLSAEDATRIKFQLSNVRVALSARA